MNQHQSLRAVLRATWFVELSAALEEGERVLAELIAEGVSLAQTEPLQHRLGELRAELRRLNRAPPSEVRVVGPAWPEDPCEAPGASFPLRSDWRLRRD